MLLVGADVLLILLHVLHFRVGFLPEAQFSIEKDSSFAEVFQYIKEYWIAGMLLWLFAREFKALYLAWSLFFGYLLLDDFLQIHEEIGVKVANRLGYAPLFHLRPQDFGEITVTLSVASVFFLLIGLSYYVSEEHLRRVSRFLAVLAVLLGFFGVIVDSIHVMIGVRFWEVIVGIVEDGGEMLVMTIACWYVFGLFQQSPV